VEGVGTGWNRGHAQVFREDRPVGRLLGAKPVEVFDLQRAQLTEPVAFCTGAWTRLAGLVPGGGMISHLPLPGGGKQRVLQKERGVETETPVEVFDLSEGMRP